MNGIIEKLNNAAYNEYTFGNLEKAAAYFEKAYNA